MKRLWILVLVFLVLFSVCSLAEGNLKVTQKNLYIIDDDDTGYLYAKVENVGDAAIGVSTGDLVIFTPDDDILLSSSYVTTLPSYVMLEPGEHLFVREFLWDSALKDKEAGDFKFSITSRETGNEIEVIPGTVTFELEGADSYNNYVYVTFTNTTDKPLYGIYATAALYDEAGNILFADGNILTAMAVHPESTVTVRISVANELMKYYELHDIVPVTAEAIVCYQVD